MHDESKGAGAMTKHAVVIAGGGPTGLMLASELALSPTDTSPGSETAPLGVFVTLSPPGSAHPVTESDAATATDRHDATCHGTKTLRTG